MFDNPSTEEFQASLGSSYKENKRTIKGKAREGGKRKGRDIRREEERKGRKREEGGGGKEGGGKEGRREGEGKGGWMPYSMKEDLQKQTRVHLCGLWFTV